MSISEDSMFLGRLERRKAGRLQCAQTTCQFGSVADLSRDGCRVICRKPLGIPEGQTVNLKIVTPGASMVITGNPVSCRKRPDGKYNVGFRFQHSSDQSRRNIIELARMALNNTDHLHRMSA